MQHSENLNEIAVAMCAFQSQVGVIGKDGDVNAGKFKFRYAKLSTILEAIREPLKDNGLSFSQLVDNADPRNPTVTTIILHTSGQYISASFTITTERADMQGIGSAISYAKRYALTAAFGLAIEDDPTEDDGQREAIHNYDQGINKPMTNNPAKAKLMQPPPELPRELHNAWIKTTELAYSKGFTTKESFSEFASMVDFSKATADYFREIYSSLGKMQNDKV